MGWTAKEIDELRKGKNGTAGSTAGSSSAHSSTAAGSRSTGSGWTPEKIDALRGSTGKRTTEAWVNRSAGASTETRRARTNTGSSQSSTGGSLGGQVLAQMMGSTNPKLQLEVPGSGTQSERNGTRGGTAQPEWLGKVGSSTPAAQVRGTVKPTEKKRQPYAATGGAMQLQSGYGAVNSAPNADTLKQTIAAGDGKRVDWYARTAQEAKEDFARNSEPDRFDELNQWMDADPKHRELVNLIRGGTGEQQPYVQRGNAMQAQDGTGAMASAPTAQSTGRRDYTDAELQAKGYTQTEINEAKAYIRDFDALPAWQRAVRRTSNTIGGIAEEIAAGGLQMGENAVQAVKNSSATKKNRDALKESLAGDARQEKLFKLVDTVDSNGSPKYSDAELIAKGYTQGEIDDMRSRYAANEVKDAVDPEKSVGYQLHKRSQDLTGAAMSGLSPLAQKVLGIVSSAGENLVVASIDPAMVLPVLSLQGAGESMGQSVEKGDSAGKTLAGGALKFGAGWAINSVGAADLAKTMGTDYARDTLAGKLADLVRSVADNGPLAQQYPVIANAVSGGVDNAMQAFVETYADMAIDAALGDSDAAQNLFKKDTFLNAVESGLTGGASGALGGAVGTGLGKMNARLDAAAGGTLSPLQSGDAGAATELSRGESLSQRNAEQEDVRADAQAQQVQQFVDETVADNDKTGRSESETAGLESADAAGPTQQAASEPVTEQTAVNDDPAVHTPAQNASIAEYKDSVDPKMAEYVDKVRAGEQLPPYMVTETSDRMRSAMQELTGLDKVGSVTMLDANGVNHITNRHAGGDGSADATMKESADVARAAYVLNNFDNAYLATRKADGYYTANRKKAPIVIFEKKIDGSHIIVEAVTDAKKSKNFIVSEYLSSVGVPEKEIAKVLQPSMDAVADPRDTSKTLSADPSATTDLSQSPMDAAESDPRHTSETLAASSSAETTVTQRAGEVNGKSVESSPAEQHGGLRGTYGLTQQSRSVQQRQAQQELTRWKVSDAASETISKNMPVDIGDAERYAAAASSLYRLGQMEDVTTFDKAMELAQGMNGLAVNTEYVLAQDGGRQALQLAWLQGHGEMEAGSMQRGTLGGELTEKSTSGSGRVLYKGTMRTANDVGTQLIELNARATDTDAVLKTVLQGNDRVKAYVDTEVAQIYFADSAEDVFGTILHEDYHWYNSLDAEGAQALQQHALEFLAKSEGYENIDAMIREKAADYAQQGLTYEQAAEELVADAWRGIFSDEASFKRWVEFQRQQAEKNAGRAGTIRKVMTKVKELLSDIVSRAKEVLAKDPENKAALRAQRLAEAEKRVLQDEYFAHAEKAMENLRSAKENAAALENKGAAEGTRFKLHEDSESLTEQMNDHLGELEEMEPVAEIRGNEVNFGKNARENVENIDAFFDSIGNKVERENFGIVELKHYGANKTVRHGNSAAKQAAVAAIPGVIRNGNQIGYEKNWQGKGYDTYVFAGPVIMDETRINEAVIVNSYTREDGRKAFYTHEVCWSDGSYVTFDDAGKPTKKEDTPTHLPMDVRSSAMAAQEVSSDTSIAQETAENKGNNGTLKKNVRYQLSETDELTKLRDEQQQLDKQRRALKEERSAWLESDAVKAIEAKKKALGIFSAEAKAYRDSEEYQNYLAKRKDYNARMAQLDDQSAALDDRMKAVNARMQQQRAAEGKAEQAAYDAKAEAYGSKAEYRRALAKEQFGTTEDFNRAGYILPDGQMLNFAQNDRTRDTDHREIMSVFGPAEVKTGTEALNEFLLDGNVRVMAEGPGIDLSADTAPTAQQLEQIRQMAQELGSARRQFTLDISTADGRVAASKEYSGRVDADRVVREIRDYYRTGELAQESGLAKFRYQLAEQASRDAKKNDQQTASRAIADKAAALDTLSQFFGLTRGVKVSQSNIEGLASRWAKANGSKVDRAKLARETEVLVEYLKADGADMEKGQALAETLAGEILDGATYRNSELWDEYPELHKLEYTVNKTGQAKAELVKAYGSWSAAVAEARKHGVSLRQAEGVRDGNPVEQYDSVINDNRAVGGTSDGAKALWKAAAQQAGVDGAMSMESTEWLNVLMNLHDAIKPATQSRFADDAEYEDAKVELAGRIIGDILNTPEMTDAQAIFEGIQQHNLQVAKAAAGSEERAAEVEKGLKGVQKAQQREFNRRMYENRRAANQSAEVQQMTELQRQNAQAEKLLDENLETLGVDTSNVGNLNEKLTFLRESYEREMKQEVKRMKAERQEMLDEAKLEMQKLRSEKNELAWQLRQEKQRADKAEYSLLVQENEIMEWEADNERKRAAFEQKQAQRNAVAIETARQQRDEDIAIAKAVAEKRVQRARDARKMDELKRSIRQNAAQLNQMLLRPSKDKYVQKNLVDAAAQVAKLADMTILNNKAVNQLTRLQGRIRQSAGSENSPNAMTEEWKQTGVDTLIQTLWDDLQTTKDAKLTKLHEQLAEAEVLPDSEKAWALQERLRKRIRETENRTYLPMTVDQMRMLKAITSSTLHVIRNANKTVSLAKAEEVSAIAEGAASEVNASKGNHPGGALDGVQNLLTKYNLDMLGAERVLRMLGGYKNGGQMEKIGQMLNDGQYRQTKITVEGEKLFANVTGKEHVKEMQNFAGPGADLVDVGLTDVKGKKAELTHAQLCSLYMHLHNTDSLNHLMNGGLVIPDAKLYNKGDIEQAYQKGQTVHLGMLTDADGTPTADSILQTVEAAMTDYDRAWCADMKEFFDNYTAKLINETSLQLVGYQRATVKNYYPIAVDKSVLATQIEGLNLDATIEGRGFLKNRVKSSKPILLEECANVVQRSLRDTADYAGLAAPIRDVQKILNSGVETREGLKNLKNGIIKEQWGGDAVNYIDNLLKDLQKKSRQRKSTLQWLGNLSSKYAGAVLTLNPGVALAQAASLPTAAAVLGGDTMAAVVPFVKNFSPKQRAALEAEIKEHGDMLLDWRKRGSQNGELASIGKQKTLAEKGMDKLPNWLTGWINGMDEVTVAALWEGSKRYVQNHTAEFEGAEVTGSPAYWEAVNRTYQKVIEQTQPNYTVMQRAGIQRNPDGMAKALTMFTTQRFQNYGILADAVGDYKAQAERYRAESSAENKAEVQRAGQQLRRAVASQTVQTVTFALMKMGVGFVLHRWKDLQDENGDMTLKSLLKRLGELCMESFAGTGLYGSEIYGFASNAVTGNDYDVVSAANLGLVNEFAAAAGKFAYELRKDIGGMDEDEAEKHDRKLWTLAGNVVEAGLQALGVPYANGKKFVEAAAGWYGTLQDWKKNGKYGNFDSLPQSATGQYDRLYNAYASGDSDEAKAAVEKLNEMGKGEDVYKQLKTRLVKYDANVKAAAEAQNAGDCQKRYELEMQMIEQLSDALRLPKGKRGDVVDCVTGAVNQLADKLLKGDNSSATDDLVEAVDSWDASAVQEEYDRLAKAGKSASTLKGKITETAKPEYLAGSDADRQQMETMLLALVDADGKALYTEKTFAQWVKAADKAESEEKKDPYAAVR